MTLDPGTSAVRQLRSHLAASLSGDPAWDVALSRLARGEAALHLAVLTEPFCSLLWTGPRPSSPGSPASAAPPTAPSPKATSSWCRKPAAPSPVPSRPGTVRSYHLTPARVAQLRDQTPHRSGPR